MEVLFLRFPTLPNLKIYLYYFHNLHDPTRTKHGSNVNFDITNSFQLTPTEPLSTHPKKELTATNASSLLWFNMRSIYQYVQNL